MKKIHLYFNIFFSLSQLCGQAIKRKERYD
nr:MAG TPA: hypothetical protein [Caudoviricetes sp.]